MRLSFWTLGTPGWSNEQVVDAAKRFGYEGIDLRCNTGGNISLDSTGAEVEGLKRLFDDAGVKIASLLAYNARGGDDGVDWDIVTRDLIANARLARRLGTANMRVNAGRPSSTSPWEAYLEGLAGASKATLAAVEDVALLVQNHPGSISGAQAGVLAEMVDDQRFGVGFSPDHCVDMGEDPVEVARYIAAWVGQIHVADRTAPDENGKMRACLPGTGIVHNRRVLEVLTGEGFDGWLSFKWEKPTYPDLPDAEIALPAFVGFIQRITD